MVLNLLHAGTDPTDTTPSHDLQEQSEAVPLSPETEVGVPSSDTTVGDQNEVLLFVREEGCPYACLGRVVVSELNLHAKPIRITWKLLDFDELNRSDHFRRIVRMNSSST